MVFQKVSQGRPLFLSKLPDGPHSCATVRPKNEFELISKEYGECPHALQSMTADGICPSISEVVRLLDGPCPMQKLTTKRYVQEWTEGGVLNLLDRHGRD